jgi:hypothetical protein
MANSLRETLDANAEETTPIFLRNGGSAILGISATITVTPRVSHDGQNWVSLTALTASAYQTYDGPVWLKYVASGVSGGGNVIASILEKFRF